MEPPQQSFGTHFIAYADGTYAEYFRKRIVVSDDGIRKYKIWLKPSKDIINLFGLKKGENLNQYGVIEKTYNFDNVWICRDDPSFGRIWIVTDFEDDQTPFSMRDEHYKEMIRNQQKEIAALKGMVASANEELEKVMNNKKEWMRSVVGVVQEALAVKKHQNPDEVMEQYDQSGG